MSQSPVSLNQCLNLQFIYLSFSTQNPNLHSRPSTHPFPGPSNILLVSNISIFNISIQYVNPIPQPKILISSSWPDILISNISTDNLKPKYQSPVSQPNISTQYINLQGRGEGEETSPVLFWKSKKSALIL